MTFRLVSSCLGSTFSLRAFVSPNKQFAPAGGHLSGEHQPERAEAGPEQEIKNSLYVHFSKPARGAREEK